jgi:GntR family transcriptional regulator / MocR family aminotransferase
VAEVARLKCREDLGSPVLDQLAYADFLDRGELDRHLRRTRLRYRRRRDIVVAALRRRARQRSACTALPQGRICSWSSAPTPTSRQSSKLSVGVYGVRAHRARHSGPPALLLGDGNLSDAAIVEGVKRLASVLAARQAPRRSGRWKVCRRDMSSHRHVGRRMTVRGGRTAGPLITTPLLLLSPPS